jgi:hypothetical protein
MKKLLAMTVLATSLFAVSASAVSQTPQCCPANNLHCAPYPLPVCQWPR